MRLFSDLTEMIEHFRMIFNLNLFKFKAKTFVVLLVFCPKMVNAAACSPNISSVILKIHQLMHSEMSLTKTIKKGLASRTETQRLLFVLTNTGLFASCYITLIIIIIILAILLLKLGSLFITV